MVIPVYDEAENLPELYERLTVALTSLGPDYEILFVNDASRDRSLELIEQYAGRDPHVKGLSFSRNFGHQTALSAGMQHAAGRYVILMDGDLQDPPEVLPAMVAKAETESWDVVYAVRRNRKESLVLRLLYKTFYRVLRRFSYIDIPLDTGDFCLMHRRVVDAVNRLPERNRFLRGLRAWVGFRQTGMIYDRQARRAGKAKYTLSSLVRLALDGLISFSYLPLRLATWVGFTFALVGMFYAALIIFRRLVMGSFVGLGGFATITVAILVLGGLQMMLIGVAGEYIGRIFEETKGRPQYIVERKIGFSDSISQSGGSS